MPGGAWGNKNAVGHGRPQVYADEFIETEAKALLEWANTDRALVLRKHGPLRGYTASTMEYFCTRSTIYYDAYAIAKDLIGCRREEYYIENKSTSPFNRYAAFYDSQLSEFEKDQEQFKVDCKNKKEEQTISASDLAEFLMWKDMKENG